MTKEEINIAIAEERGWYPYVDADGKTRWYNRDSNADLEEVPSYTTDLNAMHEVVMSLDVTIRHEYLTHLRRIVVRDATPEMHDLDSNLICDLYFYEATALQRAEAFLRTLGKWKE